MALDVDSSKESGEWNSGECRARSDCTLCAV